MERKASWIEIGQAFVRFVKGQHWFIESVAVVAVVGLVAPSVVIEYLFGAMEHENCLMLTALVRVASLSLPNASRE